MNKRQAKKGVHAHGSYKKERYLEDFYKPPYPIPRYRKKLKWIKRQWSFDQAIKECDT